MNIKSRLTFQIEKKAFRELVALIKNPVKFFEKNESTKEDCLNFLTFILRIEFAVAIIIAIIQQVVKESLGDTALRNLNILSITPPPFLLLLILISRLIAFLSLLIGSFLLDISASIIARKNNILAAKRIIAYSSAAQVITLILSMLIAIIPPTIFRIFYFFSLALTLSLSSAGVSKQYRLPPLKSVIIILLQIFLGLLVAILTFIILGISPAEVLRKILIL